LAAFSVSWSCTESVWLLGRVISQWSHRTIQTQINAHTDIHASNGIRIHDPTVRGSADNSCLWPSGHCDRRLWFKFTRSTNTSGAGRRSAMARPRTSGSRSTSHKYKSKSRQK
jgi:hypothetical protein